MMNPGARILVVDDEPQIRHSLQVNLEKRHYAVTTAASGEEALEAVARQIPDVVIVDLVLPLMDGIELTRRIRAHSPVPIIVLSAIGDERKKVEALESGADDYITKPFSMEELLARINAVLRRTQTQVEEQEENLFTIGNYSFDYQKRTLIINNQPQKLTSKENDLLRLLILNKGKVLERSYALKAIWGDDNYFNARSMDVYIAKLRKHLNQDERIEIMNVHGRGFRFFVHE